MKPYPAYKDSGVEWIGTIPKNWEVKPLKHLLLHRKGALKTGPFGSQLKQSDMQGSDIKVYNQRSVIDNDFDSNDLYISSDKFAELNEFEVIPDDILLTTRGTIGRCAIFPKNKDKGILHPCLIRIQLNQDIILNKFARFYIQDNQAFFESVKYNSNATTIDVIYGETLRNVIFVVPAQNEQDQIIKFLNCKTAQIDALIFKKERMIELLKEERTAVINQAVTKGLDPNVEMKDSGVEWLGSVPKHWEIKRLKFNASVRVSNVDKKSEEGECSVRLCNYTDVYYNDFITSDIEFMEATASAEEIRKFLLKTGDVLVTKDSEEWNDIAIPAYVTTNFTDVLCGYHLAQIRPNALFGKYLFWLLSADAINYQYIIKTTGVTRYGLGNDALNNSLVLIPLKKEQIAISNFLDHKTTQIDSQITLEQKSIELLKEYRTALISEAVTGKIDVREEAVCQK